MLAQATGRVRHYLWLIGRVAAITVGGLILIAIAALLTLRLWLWPSVPDRQDGWLAEVQAQLVDRGLTLSTGRVLADWETWYRPRLQIEQVAVTQSDGQRVLALGRLEAVLGPRSFSSLWQGRPIFSEIRLESPQLYAERRADGSIVVAGLPLGGAQADVSGLNWLLAQGRIRIDGGEILWRDAQRDRSVRLRDITFAMNNFGIKHAWALQATPPTSLGEGFVLQGDFRHAVLSQPSDIRHWAGEAFVQFDRVNLSELFQFVHLPQAVPLRVNSGQGALRAWAKLDEGSLQDLTVDLDLTDASLQWGSPRRPMTLKRLAGRVQTTLTPKLQEVSLTNVSLTSAQLKAPVKIPTARLSVARDPQSKEASVSLSAKSIDLAAGMWLAEHLPLPTGWRERVAELQPSGSLTDLRLSWQEEDEQAKKFSIESAFENLSLSAGAKRPGFSRLSGRLKATDASGDITLSGKSASLSFPGIFESSSFQWDRLDIQASWTAKHLLAADSSQQAAEVDVRIRKFSLANADLALEASGDYRWRPQGLGLADLSGRVQRADFKKIVNYVPLIAGADTRSWLKEALVSAKPASANFELRGPIDRFPFRDPAEGKFIVNAEADGATLRPAPGWPLINNIRASVVFDRHQFRLQAKGARLNDLSLSDTDARIDDLQADHPILAVDGALSGDFQKLIDAANRSPVRSMVRDAISEMRAKGQATLNLGLRLDLAQADRAQVNGRLTSSRSLLRYSAALPEVSLNTAEVVFTQAGISQLTLQGQALGGPIRVASRPLDKPVAGAFGLSVEGQASAAALETWAEEALGFSMKNTLSGSARYSALVDAQESVTRATIRTSLEGLGSALPGGLKKRPQEDWGMRVDFQQTDPKPGSASGPTQSWVITSSHQRINGRIQRAASTRNETVIDLDSRQLAGQLKWTPASAQPKGVVARSGRQTALLQARLSRLWLDKPDAAEDSSAEPTSDALAQDWPTVDLVVEDFRVGDRAWGRLEVQASPVAATRSWEILRLSMVNPDAELSGQGQWAMLTQGRGPRRSRTSLNLELQLKNGGALLARSGHPNVVKDTNGKIEGRLHWPGSPLDFSGASLNGNLSLNLQQGQFMKAEPGLARLVSVLNLQSLPRRIKLDFRDIFSEGFTYERIRGDLQFLNGQASTQNLRILGVQASVMLEGSADIRRETQDLRVLVLPELNAGLASLGYAALVNPAIGLGAFVAQYILRNPVRELLSYEYRVTGSWDDPVVESVRREMRSDTPEMRAK